MTLTEFLLARIAEDEGHARVANRWALAVLALPYSDHPDYRQEWLNLIPADTCPGGGDNEFWSAGPCACGATGCQGPRT